VDFKTFAAPHNDINSNWKKKKKKA